MSDQYIVLKQIALDVSHPPTGNTRHYWGDELMPQPSGLRIVKYGDAEGFYLLYLDENGNAMNDTFHDTLEDALEQARFEFNVTPEEWQTVHNNN